MHLLASTRMKTIVQYDILLFIANTNMKWEFVQRRNKAQIYLVQETAQYRLVLEQAEDGDLRWGIRNAECALR